MRSVFAAFLLHQTLKKKAGCPAVLRETQQTCPLGDRFWDEGQRAGPETNRAYDLGARLAPELGPVRTERISSLSWLK